MYGINEIEVHRSVTKVLIVTSREIKEGVGVEKSTRIPRRRRRRRSEELVQSPVGGTT